MSNHHRGLWGYHGHTPAGRELTVQATGIGGPSAVVVLGELIELGIRRVIRIGTCAASGAAPPAGSGIVVARALAMDGASAALGCEPGGGVLPDEGLTAALRRSSGCGSAVVVSRDVHLAGEPDPGGAGDVGDLQTAATFAICRRSGIAAAALLAVAGSAGRRLEDEPLEAALLGFAGAAAEALRHPLTL